MVTVTLMSVIGSERVSRHGCAHRRTPCYELWTIRGRLSSGFGIDRTRRTWSGSGGTRSTRWRASNAWRIRPDQWWHWQSSNPCQLRSV